MLFCTLSSFRQKKNTKRKNQEKEIDEERWNREKSLDDESEMNTKNRTTNK